MDLNQQKNFIADKEKQSIFVQTKELENEKNIGSPFFVVS